MASGGGYRNTPILEDEKSYDQWRNEISVWQLVTELKPDKQALAVTLCLPRKARQTALEIDAKELNKDDGMTRLLTKLDSVFKKETVDEAYDTYHAFGKFTRSNQDTMSDYIV